MAQLVTELYAAMQYLTWAIEEIDKINQPVASHHARTALYELEATMAVRRAMIVLDAKKPLAAPSIAPIIN